MRETKGIVSFINKRAEILEKLRVTKGLQSLIDYGYNNILYGQLKYPQLTVIDIDSEVAGEGVITGDYVEKLSEYLKDNSCYTCFVFVKSEFAQQEIDAYVRIKKILFDANLKNSYFVLWIHAVSEQGFCIFDLEKKIDITDAVASNA